jgi:hypothetical protein
MLNYFPENKKCGVVTGSSLEIRVINGIPFQTLGKKGCCFKLVGTWK